MRRKLVAGNWKMHGSLAENKALLAGVLAGMGDVKAGVPVHGMGLRLTIDDKLTIREVAAAMDYTPFNMCPSITPNFQRLVGLNLGKGFTKAVRER